MLAGTGTVLLLTVTQWSGSRDAIFVFINPTYRPFLQAFQPPRKPGYRYKLPQLLRRRAAEAADPAALGTAGGAPPGRRRPCLRRGRRSPLRRPPLTRPFHQILYQALVLISTASAKIVCQALPAWSATLQERRRGGRWDASSGAVRIPLVSARRALR
jgi:hypothetical protein